MPCFEGCQRGAISKRYVKPLRRCGGQCKYSDLAIETALGADDLGADVIKTTSRTSFFRATGRRRLGRKSTKRVIAEDAARHMTWALLDARGGTAEIASWLQKVGEYLKWCVD